MFLRVLQLAEGLPDHQVSYPLYLTIFYLFNNISHFIKETHKPSDYVETSHPYVELKWGHSKSWDTSISLWSVRGVNLTHICFWSWLHILPVRVHQCSALQDAKMQIRFETERQMFYWPIHPHRIKVTWRQICNTVDLAYLLPCPTKIDWNRRQCEELWKWREAS